MRKILFLILLCIIMVHSSFGQFFESFENVSSAYGTNPVCPSITFNLNGTNVDCLDGWKSAAGTPSLEIEPICIYARTENVPWFPCTNYNKYLILWTQDFDNRRRIIGEAAYINNYPLLPNRNYQLRYRLRVPAMGSPVSTDAKFKIVAYNNGLTPYYFPSSGSCGTSMPSSSGVLIEERLLPQSGIPNWEYKEVFFSTANNTFNQIAFFPETKQFGKSQILIHLDDIIIIDMGDCIPSTNTDIFLQNNSIYPNTSLNTLLGRDIVGGNNVTSNLPIGDYIVSSNQNLSLRASNLIELRPGFSVNIGANFSAEVATSSNCFSIGQSIEPTESLDMENVEIVDSINTKELFYVAPNPTTGNFVIAFDNQQYPDEIKIYNKYAMDVTPIYSFKKMNNIEFDFSNYKKGLYFIRVRFGDTWLEKKILLE